MFGRVTTELVEVFSVPPALLGRVSTEMVERFDVPPASGRVSTELVEVFSLGPAPAALGRVATVLIEAFSLPPVVPTPLGPQVSPYPFTGFTITLPDNLTVVEADPQPYSNTKDLIVYNTDTTNRVFMTTWPVGTAGVLPPAGSITELNSQVIPAGGSQSLCIGMEGQRVAYGTVASWAAEPGQNYTLVFKAEAGVNVKVNITYVQGIGGSSGPRSA